MTAAFGRVAVLMGGWSAEREISLLSGAAVCAGLIERNIDAVAVDINRQRLLGLKDEGFDRAWVALHGAGGEDGVAQAALELLGLPYTGSGILASALAMDKRRCKALWAGQGIPTPAWRLLDGDSDPAQVVAELGLPLFVKPAREGSSLGMTRVDDAQALAAAHAEAARYDTDVLGERYIAGPEYTAAVLGDQVLPMLRIEAAGGFYDYRAKYQCDTTRYHCPSGLSQAQEERFAELSLQAFRTVGARGWGRVDFLLDSDGEPWFLELNTVPGMTSHSLVPMAARAAGIGFPELVERILDLGCKEEP